MGSTIKWRFPTECGAIQLGSGLLNEGRIRNRGSAGCFVYGPYLDVPAGKFTARFIVEPGARGAAMIDVVSEGSLRYWASAKVELSSLDGPLSISTDLAEASSQLEVRIFTAAETELSIVGLEIDLEQAPTEWPPSADRLVGTESRKSFAKKLENGFLEGYLSGPAVLEVGYRGYYEEVLPIVPQAIGVDIGYPGYDGLTLPFADESFDAVYSSHCLEHIPDPAPVLRDWYRLLKIGGFLIIAVPHQLLYERRRALPSALNPDHRRFYTIRSLMGEIEEAFEENSYRVRHLADNDLGYDYRIRPHSPPVGNFEVELVLEKIERPAWNLDDHTVRAYSASEFQHFGTARNPWAIEIDLSADVHCAVWGPYTTLGPAKYCVNFYFQAAEDALMEGIVCEVARNMETVTSAYWDVAASEPEEPLKRITVPFTQGAERGPLEFRVVPPRNGSGLVSFLGVNIEYA